MAIPALQGRDIGFAAVERAACWAFSRGGRPYQVAHASGHRVLPVRYLVVGFFAARSSENADISARADGSLDFRGADAPVE